MRNKTMDVESSDFNEAVKKFAKWVETNEKLLRSTCHCCPELKQPLSSTPNSNGATNGGPKYLPYNRNMKETIIRYHQNLQGEVEEHGNKLNCELKKHIDHEDHSPTTKLRIEEAADLERRWHKLWLESLEQLVVVERTRRCPQHNSTIIGKTPLTPANKSVAKPNRIRPSSYPNNNDRLEWDYRYTLSLTGCHKENGSHIDLDSVDEQVTKNLTEFGENYELWLAKEDEVPNVAVHSRPPSVAPAEEPEIARAVVTSDRNREEDVNCNLLMLTTPSSIFSVDSSKCLHQKSRNKNYTRRIIGSFILAVFLILFSAIYHEPHHMHKSYYHTQPPV